MYSSKSRILVALLLLGLILHHPESNSVSTVYTSDSTSHISRKWETYQFNEYELQWVVDSTLRGDTFPTVIYSMITLNVTVKTTWGTSQNFSFQPKGFGSANVAWIKLPEISQGKGTVFIFVNNDFKESYDLEWASLPPIIKMPTRIYYSYRWHSVWSGSTLLEVNLWSNGTMKISNSILKRHTAESKLGLYNSAFNFVQHEAIPNWRSFWEPIDFSEAHNWQSWNYHNLVVTCDGGGFEERGVLFWGENMQYDTSVNKRIDKDTCSGGRTLLSHPEISQFFNLIRVSVRDIIDTHLIQESPKPTQESPKSTIDYPIHAVILAFPILSVFIILKKRRKMKNK